MNGLPYLHRAAFTLRTFSPAMLPLALCLPLQAQSQSGTAQDRGLAAGDASSIQAKPAAPRAQADFGKLPLSFAANQGQVDKQVRFTSQGSGYSLFLTDKEAVLALTKAAIPVKPKEGLNGTPPQSENPLLQHPAKNAMKTDVVRMQVAGAAPGLKVEGEEQLPGVANYYTGNDPAKWHTGVPTYAKVKYAGVYPGIDLVYYGNQRQLEYDFVVAPGADAKQVRLHFVGAEKLKLNADGDLTVIAKNGEIAFHKPVVYQLKSGQLESEQLKTNQGGSESGRHRDPVDGKFVLLAGNEVRFQLGDYDRSRAVTIDPVLVYATYLGGSPIGPNYDGDGVSAIAVDGSGSAYVTGHAYSTDFPVTKGAYQVYSYGFATFVTKLNPTGTALEYSTYLGGKASDAGTGIAVDNAGHAYVTGYVFYNRFPTTPGAFQRVNKGAPGNAFVVKLVTSGGLDYSTYLGGTGSDSSYAIAVDAAGHAYVTGNATSTDFPVTPGAFQTVNKGSNVFVTRLNESGTALDYSTYLGGTAGDTGYAIAVDATGHVFVTGTTSSNDFPTTPGAFQTVNHGAGESNVFVTKLNGYLTGLDYSTYLGGSGGEDGIADSGYGIAVDALGHAYVTGSTYSADFPVTPGAFQAVLKAQKYCDNAFVTKLNREGTALDYSTYLGGSGTGGSAGFNGDVGVGIAVDASGTAYVTGQTYSTNFPTTPGAFQTVNAAAKHGPNAFITLLSGSGRDVTYSTYLGGSVVAPYPPDGPSYGESGSGIALDALGNVYVGGVAYSVNFPVTPGAFQTVNNGEADHSSNGFITKFTLP